MELTKEFISKKFNEYNKEYFDGKLHTPSFKVVHTKSHLGLYHWEYDYNRNLKSEIRISDMYDRSETDICNTIIHEMIHQYIKENNIKDTRKHHGKVFYAIAERINRQGGWHIARTDSVVGCGLKDKTKASKYYICCYMSGKAGKPFCFRINEKYVEKYKTRFDASPKHFNDPFIFLSNDDKKYAHFPACHSGVRGWWITKGEYNKLRKEENLIYNQQTLGIKSEAA